jgi:lipopolysaccharide transport system ATP-binding protein
MNDIAIKFENISKQYRLGQIGTGTLSHDLNRWWHKVRGHEDPYLKIGESNDRSKKGDSEYVWALKDIDFEVKKGEVLGIIGKNGAGKSTLLKILSKVTKPTTGAIKANGRIASLLEVGTGFHPEMTGRENVYMNGSIMGMTKSEITRKFDEIVSFAGVERYIDTPVKRYSSGMLVRLGFAIAAHLEPEILVVDEVLAVGDAEFQKKAIGKMQNVSKNEGRTVLFVSHNMASILDLCNKGILLENGSVINAGNTHEVVSKYISLYSDGVTDRSWKGNDAPGCEHVRLRRAYTINSNYEQINDAFINQEFGLCVEYEVLEEIGLISHSVNVFNILNAHLFTSHDDMKFDKSRKIKKGFYRTVAWIPANLLQNDTIDFSFACIRYNPFEVLFHEKNLIRINVHDSINSITRNPEHRGGLPGLLRPKLKWDFVQEISVNQS